MNPQTIKFIIEVALPVIQKTFVLSLMFGFTLYILCQIIIYFKNTCEYYGIDIDNEEDNDEKDN